MNVQFKHQSGTQYIEGTKREDCLLYALKCAMNFKCESDEIRTQVQKSCLCAKRTQGSSCNKANLRQN